ncbi:hypothetical protein MIS45_11255 [Wielerella bovis]|uniref:hypothetical protein n=1 Tax=Wielerella bovis TaxID=2917790 RepID=UPI002019A6A9|nr:hypothetical protein [Wielerella bovis]ULJ69297.1 hypothetical protein MIS45_11255 [Wielerella bovis]
MDLILKRNDTQETVELPQDLRWIDEHDWSAIAQTSPERTLSGSQIIQQGIKQSGRPITLSADNVWLPLSTVQKLRDWTDVPELKMTYIHYDSRAFQVIFALHEQALKAEPVHFTTPELGSEHYIATIKLLTV